MGTVLHYRVREERRKDKENRETSGLLPLWDYIVLYNCAVYKHRLYILIWDDNVVRLYFNIFSLWDTKRDESKS